MKFLINFFSNIKTVFLFLNLNFEEMKNARKFVDAVNYQFKTFDLIENYISYFNKNEIKGYVSSDNRTDDSLNITIGSGKFTIASSILSNGTILFSVFEWQFDLSSLTRYSHNKLDRLTFQKKAEGNCLKFRDKQAIEDGSNDIIYDFKTLALPTSVEFLFDVIEGYIESKETHSTSPKLTFGK